MSETPDFERIAAHLVDVINDDLYGVEMRSALVEALRQVWNARGAADIELAEQHYDFSGAEVAGYLRTLDR